MSESTTNLNPEQKLAQVRPTIDAIEECQVPDMPVEDFIEECEAVNNTAQQDAEQLLARGLNPIFLNTLPLRIDVCRYVQGIWFNDRKEITEAKEQWDKEAPAAFTLRDLLIDEYDFAFFQQANLISTLRAIREGSSNGDMVQDLTNLGIMGKENTHLLESTNFDINLIDKAITCSDRMGTLLAIYNDGRNESNDNKILRDKAYAYLKEAVSEIRRVGRFVFRDNPDRLEKYYSEYRRKHR